MESIKSLVLSSLSPCTTINSSQIDSIDFIDSTRGKSYLSAFFINVKPDTF